jgi:AraC-like DNA-binding protein
LPASARDPSGVATLKAWCLDASSFPPEKREHAWLEAMDRLCLPVSALPERDELVGRIASLKSPLGTEISLVDSGPHELGGRYLQQPSAIWLTLLLKGQAVLSYEDNTIELTTRDIVYGPTGVDATLSFESAFRQLFVKLPRLLFDSQLITPIGLRVERVGAGIGEVLLAMLRSMAEVVDTIDSDQLRPIELSLTEFLIGAFGIERAGSGVRSSHLQRIRQTIETMLSNPGLSLEMVAEAEGVSPRYLQKLFAESGDTFRGYRRKRRLERCRADLVSPLYAHLSITEICFRWGFNGSAHFSRAFHEAFGVSPRDYRQAARRKLEASTTEVQSLARQVV